MKQKTVKFEIGKLLAIVITIVVIAGLASAYLSSDFYKGMLQGDEKMGALTAEQEAALAEDCYFFTEDELNYILESKYITEEETLLVDKCLKEQQSEVKIDGSLTAEQEAALAEDCNALTREEIYFYMEDENLNEDEAYLLENCIEEINKVYLETDTALTEESLSTTESTYEQDMSLDSSTESTTQTYEETQLKNEDNTLSTTESTYEQDTRIEDGTTEATK